LDRVGAGENVIADDRVDAPIAIDDLGHAERRPDRRPHVIEYAAVLLDQAVVDHAGVLFFPFALLQR
jgi:hypothetical protein